MYLHTMKVRYLLKKRGKDTKRTHPIFIALYDGDQTELIYTGQRVKASEWEPTSRIPKDHAGEVYKEIEKVRRLVEKAKLTLELEDQLSTPLSVKSKYESLLSAQFEKQLQKEKVIKAGKKTIYALATDFCENLPDTAKQSTRKTIRISIQQFMDFLVNTGRKTMERQEFNEETIAAYSKYLLTKPHGKGGRKKVQGTKKGLASSTYNKRMKHLRQFLKAAKVEVTIKLRKVRKKQIIALTLDELQQLRAVDVTLHKDLLSHPYLQRAKDMFLLGCYTALRISDLKRINPTNSADGFIKLTTTKNNELFNMPIVPEAKEILECYNYRAPAISEQEVNRSIKKVCELAGINKLVEVTEDVGGRESTKTIPKYQLITSHVAGKTFITNAKELWGLDPAEVAGVVRKDLKTMLNHYFKPPVESAIQKMMHADKVQMKVA
jgi:Phage integrase SAM-like domain